MSGRVEGKKALITGAAQGLGAASAWGLAREGARVLITDVNEAGARQVAAAIDAELGAGVAHSMRHDVSSEDDWIAATARARETMGGLSVLVNNAGVAILGSVEDLSLAEWRRGMAVNADSVFLGSKHALPLMRENQPGFDHQHFVDLGTDRGAQYGQLQRVQGRGLAVDQIDRAALRQAGREHPLQLDPSDLHSHADPRGPDRKSRRSRRPRQVGAPGSDGPSGRTP